MNLDDPKLTAHALGELTDPEELLEVETWLASHEEGRRFVAETREMAALLSERLHNEPVPTLTDEQRRAILGGGETAVVTPSSIAPEVSHGKVRRISFVAALTALAACLAAGPFLPWGELLRLQQMPQQEVAANTEPTFKVAMETAAKESATPFSMQLDQKQPLVLEAPAGARELKMDAPGEVADTFGRDNAKKPTDATMVSGGKTEVNTPDISQQLASESDKATGLASVNGSAAPMDGMAARGASIIAGERRNSPVAEPVATAAPATLMGDLLLATNPALSASPNQLSLLVAQAGKYFAEGRFDLALIRWKQILQLDPTNADALAGLAQYEKIRDQSLIASVDLDKATNEEKAGAVEMQSRKSESGKNSFRSLAPASVAASAPVAAQMPSASAASGSATMAGLAYNKNVADIPSTATVFNIAKDSGSTASVVAGGSIHIQTRSDFSDTNALANDDEAGHELRKSKQAEKVTSNTESYDSITENSFLMVRENPLSTFSIDVDTASYANVRRFLNEGQLPPRGAVRIEEMLNYFSYDYPAPSGETPFSTQMEVSECPWQPEHRLVRIGLRGRDIPASQRPAGNLVFLIDVSGSMNEPNKLPLLKQSLRLLVDQLGAEDQVAMVVYAGNSGLVLPSTSDKERIRAALDNLEAGGSTNGASGIQLAYQVAAENFIKGGTNRVILATDGDFNVGVTNQSDLVDLIKARAKTGVFLSVLGFGTGNVKDSTMEKLADQGNGNYAYIDNLNEGRKVLVEQVGGTLCTIAKDVKMQIEFNPSIVSAYRLIGYENRMLRKEDFNDDKKDAGEIGANIAVTALYEVVPIGSLVPVGAVDALKYSNNALQVMNMPTSEMLTLKLRYKQPDSDVSTRIEFPLVDQGARMDRASTDFRFAAAVAEAGLLLRHSENKELAAWDAAIELAAHALGEDRNGYRKEFVELLRKAKSFSQKEG